MAKDSITEITMLASIGRAVIDAVRESGVLRKSRRSGGRRKARRGRKAAAKARAPRKAKATAAAAPANPLASVPA